MAKAEREADRDKSPAIENIGAVILHEMATPPNMPGLLKSIVEWAVELLQADAGDIYLWDQEIGAFRQSTIYGFAEQYTGIPIKPGEGISGKVFQSGEPMIVEDYPAWEGRAAAFASLPPFTTALGVPMRWQGRTIGVLSILADARRHTFDENDIRLATLFANLAAVAIENAQLYEALQNRSEELKYTLEQEVAQRTTELARRALQLETSAQVSREITSILDIDDLLSRVVGLIRDAFGYYHVHVFLVDKEVDRLVLRASSDAVGSRLQRLEIGPGSLNGQVAQTNEALLVNDAAHDPRCLTDEQLPDTQSELVIPLRVGDRVIGTLDVQSAKANAFTPEDVLVVQSLGDQIAVAIENARLYDRSRELAVLEERSRLARELHDSVTQSLFSMSLTAEATRILLERDPARVAAQLHHLQKLAQGALTEMRSLIYQLRPTMVAEEGLVSALRQHIAERQSQNGLRVALHVEGERPLPRECEDALFRIVQEALNNVVKHAQTDQAKVTLRLADESVSLLIEDHGLGFDPSTTPFDPSTGLRAGPARDELRTDPASTGSEAPRLGLTSMRERAERQGGTFAIESQPGAGTRIRVEIPQIQER